MDAKAARRREIGHRGEDLAAEWYEAHGYEVVARNWRCRAGELDIVARKGSQLVFCEVKTRSSDSFGLPAEAVGYAKQARVRRLAGMWLTAARSGARARPVGERRGSGKEAGLSADEGRGSRPPAPSQGSSIWRSRTWRVRFDVASVLDGTVEIIEEAF
ncbi:MAG: YraN family protein [Actinomycetota bacterium]|nr:YraN family protein [Actinomycetota bacterium]